MKVSVSVLSSNNRLKYINELNHTNCEFIHVDVMDGKFVSDVNFSFDEIKAINCVSNKKLDVHLMVDKPLSYIDKLKDYNIEYISFHAESGCDIKKVIDKIHKIGCKASIAISPDTSVDSILEYLPSIDMVLIMSVEPGRGGQKFIYDTVNKVQYIKKVIDDNKYNCLIEVDGGINNETSLLISCVDIAVVGSYILNNCSDYFGYQKNIDNIVGISNNKIVNNNYFFVFYFLLFCLLCYIILLFVK